MSVRGQGEPFSHVLCWVDGSDAACRAAERAALLAQSMGAGLSYIAIGAEPVRDEGFDEYARIERVSVPVSTAPVLESDVQACLDEAASIAERVGHSGAGRILRTGNEAVAICDAARMLGADLLVLRRCKPGLVERIMNVWTSRTPTDECGFDILSVG